jgi:iron uptake system component EfeO
MRVVLGNGDYAFRCLADGEEGVTGPTIRLTGGSNRSSPAIAPVTYNDLLQPLKQYRGYVISGLNTLATDARDISDQRTWLAAHLDYERLGAAYGTFGDADQAIQNAFQAIEKDLWQGGSTIQADVAALNSAISSLQKDFPSAQIDPMDLGLRAHEILENAVQFELTEKTDNGSNTNLRTVSANIDGTKEILTVLRPLLATRYPALPQVDAALNAEQQLIDSSPPLNQISTMQREKINGGISNLTELLAPIAAICEPRRTQ